MIREFDHSCGLTFVSIWGNPLIRFDRCRLDL